MAQGPTRLTGVRNSLGTLPSYQQVLQTESTPSIKNRQQYLPPQQVGYHQRKGSYEQQVRYGPQYMQSQKNRNAPRMLPNMTPMMNMPMPYQ